MTATGECLVYTEDTRIPDVRESHGNLRDLVTSIKDEGLRHPIVLWEDGTVISGGRRLAACMLLGRLRIPTVYVDTIEDAAKLLLADNEDDRLALPMTWDAVCRLWAVLRRLDAPAARRRADEHRRRGVELRRLTQSGQRAPGRARQHTEDYVLSLLGPVYGMSEATARRLWVLWSVANGLQSGPPERLVLAREAFGDVEHGETSISAAYQRLMTGRAAPAPKPRSVEQIPSADAKTQLAAWGRSLPTMEGLVSALVELGPPNAELTWEQVGPTHARLSAIRRHLEKMIKQMKETNQS